MTRWTEREIAAPADVVWALLVDVDRWAEWGPSVRRAQLSTPHLQLGSRGRVTTVVGVTVPFVITRFEPGKSWSWDVAGVRATDHRVVDLGGGRCRVAFGVPLVALPYLAVCRVALRRLAERSEAGDRASASEPGTDGVWGREPPATSCDRASASEPGTDGVWGREPPATSCDRASASEPGTDGVWGREPPATSCDRASASEPGTDGVWGREPPATNAALAEGEPL